MCDACWLVHVGISCNEWYLGTWRANGTGAWDVELFTTIHAMYAATILTRLIQNADKYGIQYANFYQVPKLYLSSLSSSEFSSRN